jgi:hypothetical protein
MGMSDFFGNGFGDMDINMDLDMKFKMKMDNNFWGNTNYQGNGYGWGNADGRQNYNQNNFWSGNSNNKKYNIYPPYTNQNRAQGHR